MEKNIKEKIVNYNLKNANGITLIALVITIIVLLILAGVSLSMVLNQDGIFSRAEQATDKYGQAKARETLELAFGTLQAEKYEVGLTNERLDARITEEIGKMGGEETGENKNEVIVDSYRFLVDRTVPKVVEELGPADGVIISAVVTPNGDWTNPKSTVTGLIKTYSGGTITSSTAEVIKGNADILGFPSNGGNFTIADISEDTDIKITATDSNNKTNTRTIKVVIVRDTTPPVISNVAVTVSGMKITISATATDSESGITSFTYNVTGAGTATPETGKTFTSGVPLELTTSVEGNYTVTFTATNGAGMSTTTKGITVTTSDAISIAELKKILKEDASKYPDYLGTKVNYKPDDTKAWRLFYYDATGEFGDGAGTMYLKRDYDTTRILTEYYNMSSATTNGLKMMKQLNPDWDSKDGVANLGNEKAAAGLCDTDNWTSYCDTSEARYAIGAAPIEMWTKAYNAYLNKYEAIKVPGNLVNCGRRNEYGYGWGLNGGSLSSSQTSISIDKSIPQSEVLATGLRQWLASPSSSGPTSVCIMGTTYVGSSPYDHLAYGICPVVCLKN